jgi:hypothetical protein
VTLENLHSVFLGDINVGERATTQLLKTMLFLWVIDLYLFLWGEVGIRASTQGFSLARKVLYHWSHASSP